MEKWKFLSFLFLCAELNCSSFIMKATLSKLMMIAGILITAVLTMLITRNVDDTCFDGFHRILCKDSGSAVVKGLQHNNAGDSYFNRRYLQIKGDSIRYDLGNSRSCEATEQNKGESESSPHGCIQNLREYKKDRCSPMFGCLVGQEKQTANAHRFCWRFDCASTLFQLHPSKVRRQKR